MIVKDLTQLRALRNEYTEAKREYEEDKDTNFQAYQRWESAVIAYERAAPDLIELVLRIAEWDAALVDDCITEMNKEDQHAKNS